MKSKYIIKYHNDKTDYRWTEWFDLCDTRDEAARQIYDAIYYDLDDDATLEEFVRDNQYGYYDKTNSTHYAICEVKVCDMSEVQIVKAISSQSHPDRNHALSELRELFDLAKLRFTDEMELQGMSEHEQFDYIERKYDYDFMHQVKTNFRKWKYADLVHIVNGLVLGEAAISNYSEFNIEDIKVCLELPKVQRCVA